MKSLYDIATDIDSATAYLNEGLIALNAVCQTMTDKYYPVAKGPEEHWKMDVLYALFPIFLAQLNVITRELEHNLKEVDQSANELYEQHTQTKAAEAPLSEN